MRDLLSNLAQGLRRGRPALATPRADGVRVCGKTESTLYRSSQVRKNIAKQILG